MPLKLELRNSQTKIRRKRSKHISFSQINHNLTSTFGYERHIDICDEHAYFNRIIHGEKANEQWGMVENYCWLHFGKQDDAWERFYSGRVPHASMHEIGVSDTDALTDEDEFTLEFGTKEEKRDLLASIKLTSKYRIMDEVIQRQTGENSWEDILNEEDLEKEEEKL